MKKYSKNKHHELSELNITPLLDLAFVLLVIFILTTAPPINNVDIALPTAAPNPKEAKGKSYYVEINNRGEIKFNTLSVDEGKLRDKLVEFRKADPELNVIVRADHGLPVQRLVTVLDVLIDAKVPKFGLSTDAPPPPPPK